VKYAVDSRLGVKVLKTNCEQPGRTVASCFQKGVLPRAAIQWCL